MFFIVSFIKTVHKKRNLSVVHSTVI